VLEPTLILACHDQPHLRELLRWRVPVGTTTFLYAVVAGLCGAITAFGLPSIVVTLLNES
jgi:hypothetical protein